MNEKLKFACLLSGNLLTALIIFTTLASSTNIDGISDTVITGTFTVGGECYMDGSIGCVPSGTLLLFTTACPTGWTRQTAFDGRHMLFSSTPGSNGGASTHSHTYTHTHGEGFSDGSTGASHSHSVSLSGGSVGNHAHTGCSFCTYAQGGNSGPYGYWLNTASSGFAGSHSHTGWTGVSSSNTFSHTHTESGITGSSSPSTDAASNQPAYINMVVCKKD